MSGLLALVLAAAAPSPVSPAPAPPVAAAPVDAARLALGRQVVARLMPDGTYRRMLDGTMKQLIDGMTGQMLNIRLRDLAGLGGVSQAEIARLGPATLREIMQVMDPAYDQRMKLGTTAMIGSMTDLVATMEPDIREALGDAYARRFTTAELTAMEDFFRSPAGSKFASNSMTIAMDPAVMQRMQVLMPRLMGAMPDMVKRAQAATAGLPSVRRYDSLTPAEKARLSALLGTSSPAAKGGAQ